MAQLKANSTVGGLALANINLDGVAKSNFTTAQLAQVKGNDGANGSSGSDADSSTWSVSGSTLAITGSTYSLTSTNLNINTI